MVFTQSCAAFNLSSDKNQANLAEGMQLIIGEITKLRDSNSKNHIVN